MTISPADAQRERALRLESRLRGERAYIALRLATSPYSLPSELAQLIASQHKFGGHVLEYLRNHRLSIGEKK